jgi:hypothetical protein
MTSQTLTKVVSPYRSAGWFAIVSGAVGIVAIGFLILYLTTRAGSAEIGFRMLSYHHANLAVQFLLMIPVLSALRNLLQQRSKGMSRGFFNLGVGAIFLTIVCLMLGIIRIFNDGLFTFPQGVFGVWLIIVSWRLKGVFSKGLGWYGMIVGFGLMLVGTFEPLFAIFVDPILLRIPPVPPEQLNIKITPADMVIHYIFFTGSLLGVLMLPFWTILMGVRLFREKNF